MTDKEKNLYEFLLHLPMETFDNWLEHASDAEIELADRLFEEVRYAQLDKVEDLTDAQNVLKQFTLQG